MHGFEFSIGRSDQRRAFISKCISDLTQLENQNLCVVRHPHDGAPATAADTQPEKTYYKNCIDLLDKIRNDTCPKSIAKQVLVVLFFYFYTNHTDEYFESFATQHGELNRCIHDTVLVKALPETQQSECDVSAEYYIWSHLYERVMETVEGNATLAQKPKTVRDEHNIRMQHPLRLAAEMLTRTHSVWGAPDEYRL